MNSDLSNFKLIKVLTYNEESDRFDSKKKTISNIADPVEKSDAVNLKTLEQYYEKIDKQLSTISNMTQNKEELNIIKELAESNAQLILKIEYILKECNKINTDLIDIKKKYNIIIQELNQTITEEDFNNNLETVFKELKLEEKFDTIQKSIMECIKKTSFDKIINFEQEDKNYIKKEIILLKHKMDQVFVLYNNLQSDKNKNKPEYIDPSHYNTVVTPFISQTEQKLLDFDSQIKNIKNNQHFLEKGLEILNHGNKIIDIKQEGLKITDFFSWYFKLDKDKNGFKLPVKFHRFFTPLKTPVKDDISSVFIHKIFYSVKCFNSFNKVMSFGKKFNKPLNFSLQCDNTKEIPIQIDKFGYGVVECKLNVHKFNLLTTQRDITYNIFSHNKFTDEKYIVINFIGVVDVCFN